MPKTIQQLINEGVAAKSAEIRDAAFAEAKKLMQKELKAHSKDFIAKRDNASDEEKAQLKNFYLAAFSGDKALIQKSNDEIVKDYEAKGMEWRNEDELKRKAQTVGTGAQGGILVPVTLRESIIAKMYYISPIRQLATVLQDMPAILDMPFDLALPTTYWVGEGAAITESGATFAKKQLVPYKLAALDKFSSESLADTATTPALQNVVEDRFATALALAENVAFAAGDGASKPFGFRSSDITPTIVTGNTTAGNLAFTDINNLFFSLPTAYRKLASFQTSSAGLKLIYNLKDGNGRPLYVPSLDGSAPSTFLGRPIEIIDEIPANLGAGTNETELWFDVFTNYWIGNHGPLRVDYGTDGTDFSQDKITMRMIERVAGRPFMDLAWAKMNIK